MHLVRSHGFESVGKLSVYLPLRLLGRLSVGRARPIVCSEVGVLSTNSRGIGCRSGRGVINSSHLGGLSGLANYALVRDVELLFWLGNRGCLFDNSFSQLLLNNKIVFDSKIFTLEFYG